MLFCDSNKSFCCFFVFTLNAQNHSHSHKHDGLHHWEIPSKDPDRIILTFNGDPSTKRAVTWRTDLSVKNAKAQIAVAGVNSKFAKNDKNLQGKDRRI